MVCNLKTLKRKKEKNYISQNSIIKQFIRYSFKNYISKRKYRKHTGYSITTTCMNLDLTE